MLIFIIHLFLEVLYDLRMFSHRFYFRHNNILFKGTDDRKNTTGSNWKRLYLRGQPNDL